MGGKIKFFDNIKYTNMENKTLKQPKKNLKEHKIENFFDSDFGICDISL